MYIYIYIYIDFDGFVKIANLAYWIIKIYMLRR